MPGQHLKEKCGASGMDRRLLQLFPTEYPAFNITRDGKNVDINITGDGTLIKRAADPPLPAFNITAAKGRLGLDPKNITLTKPDLNINKTGAGLNLNFTGAALNVSADPAYGVGDPTDPATFLPINCTAEGQFIPFNIPSINVPRRLPCSYSGYIRPFNFTNLPGAAVNSVRRAAATGQSIGEYVGNVAPSRIMDLLNPVGNFTGVTTAPPWRCAPACYWTGPASCAGSAHTSVRVSNASNAQALRCQEMPDGPHPT